MKGFPRSDIERVMRHYGVSQAEAERGLRAGVYPLPEYGSGLTTGKAAGLKPTGLVELFNALPWWQKVLVVVGGAAAVGGVAIAATKLWKR